MPKYLMTVEAQMTCHTTVEVEAESEESAREVAAMIALDNEPITQWDYTREDYEVTAVQEIKKDA